MQGGSVRGGGGGGGGGKSPSRSHSELVQLRAGWDVSHKFTHHPSSPPGRRGPNLTFSDIGADSLSAEPLSALALSIGAANAGGGAGGLQCTPIGGAGGSGWAAGVSSLHAAASPVSLRGGAVLGPGPGPGPGGSNGNSNGSGSSPGGGGAGAGGFGRADGAFGSNQSLSSLDPALPLRAPPAAAAVGAGGAGAPGAGWNVGGMRAAVPPWVQPRTHHERSIVRILSRLATQLDKELAPAE